MKRSASFLGVLVLAMLAGLALSGCDTLEDGIGTVKLTNKSDIIVVYWSLEKFGETIWEGRSTVYPGGSASQDTQTALGIKVYVEDSDGDGWLSDTSYTVKKDETVEVKFHKDFSPIE
jgi:hypothetical protein